METKLTLCLIDCVGDQAGLRPGDVIVSANTTELRGLSGKEVQRSILRVVADLHLTVIRPMNQNRIMVANRRHPKRTCASPAKISCRYDYSSDDSDSDEEITTKTNQMTLNPRLKGMQSLLRYDDGVNPVKLIQDGRDFVYSGSCLVRISGKHILQSILFFFSV